MTLSSATLVSIEEYSAGHYEPDADYVDGRIEERPMGELDHSKLQREFLFRLSRFPYFDCWQELRVRTSPTRFRIPDICLIRADAPEEQVATVPPLLCIEVLSPDDTMPRTMVRVEDFLRMGVPEVWIFDPKRRTVHLCTESAVSVQTTGTLTVPETPVTLQIEEIFAILDRKRRSQP